MNRQLGPIALAICLVLPTVCFGQADSKPRSLDPIIAELRHNGSFWVREGAGWLMEREIVTQLIHMTSDKRGGTGGGGWYRPSQSRYGWKWLSPLDRDGDGAISLAEFGQTREWFEALDKDGDGQLTSEDFEWFGTSALAKASSQVKNLFNRIDGDGNGQVTPEEFRQWFDILARGKPYVAQDDFLSLFMDNKRFAGGKRPGAAKNRTSVVLAYLCGDVGSLSEGPDLGQIAPDFTVKTVDGKGQRTLADHRGKKPLVMIFGSFT